MYLVAACCTLAENAPPHSGTAVSSPFSEALADVSSEGSVVDWISVPHWTARGRGGRNVVRGQNATDPGAYDSAPQGQSSSEAQAFVQGVDPSQTAVGGPIMAQPYPSGAPYDPFLGGGVDPLMMQGAPPGLEYYDPYSRDFQYGYNGYQPYRLDSVVSNYELGYLNAESVSGSGATGKLSVTEVNARWRLSSYLPSGAIFSWKPEFNYRGYDGPLGIGLPGHAYRFASDFEIGGQGPGPWGFQLGFTPQLTSDFDKQLNRSAYLFDGRGMLFFRPDPTLMLVGGVAFWDRVKDTWVPHAGVVWTPDEQWEFRLMYPKSRISVLLGDTGLGPLWLYGSAEYTVEAFQIGLPQQNGGDQVELRDYRALVGLRSDDACNVQTFLEGGWVWGRKVDYAGSTPDFSISDGWMIRAGIRY